MSGGSLLSFHRFAGAARVAPSIHGGDCCHVRLLIAPIEAVQVSVIVLNRPGDRPPLTQASTFRPCFSTMASNLSAMPLGRLVPASHFWTVDSLVFR